MFKLCSLASGSKGNAIFVSDGNTKMLVDCGISYSNLCEELCDIGEDVRDLSGVVVTHEHIDHVRGLEKLVEAGVPVYAHSRTARAVNIRLRANVPFEPVSGEYEAGFFVGSLEIRPFRVPHDATYPLAYSFLSDGEKLSVVTDLGHVTVGVCNNVKDSDILLIESNHDVAMLLAGNYPNYLKQRILGERGHLSNTATGDFLSRGLTGRTKRIILGHLSEQNNTPSLAYDTVAAALSESGLSDTDVGLSVATQHEHSELIIAK